MKGVEVDSRQLDRHWRIMAGKRHAYSTGSLALLSPWTLGCCSDGGDGGDDCGSDGGGDHDDGGNDGCLSRTWYHSHAVGLSGSSGANMLFHSVPGILGTDESTAWCPGRKSLTRMWTSGAGSICEQFSTVSGVIHG